MAWVFDNQRSATLKFTKKNAELSIPGINGEITDANVIVNGVTLLLNIGGIAEKYDPEDAVRTVKQNVNSN